MLYDPTLATAALPLASTTLNETPLNVFSLSVTGFVPFSFTFVMMNVFQRVVPL